MAAIDVEIDRNIRARFRQEAELNELERQAAGACCPTCFHGSRYALLADRAERCGRQLAALLRKRGREDDLGLARAIDVSAWP